MQLVDGTHLFDWTGPVDASFKPWCRYSEHALYFAIIGRDNFVVEPRGEMPGDLFEIRTEILRDGSMEPTRILVPLFDAGDGLAVPTWENGVPVQGADGEIAPRSDGYFVEFSIPLDQLPGLEHPFAPRPFALSHIDWDYDAASEHEAVISTADVRSSDPEDWGTLVFDGPARAISEVVRDSGGELPTVIAFANVGGESGAEVAFATNTVLSIAGPALGNFDWVAAEALPTGATVVAIDSRDINHDGFDEVFVTFERTRRSIDAGGDVTETITEVWTLGPEGLSLLISQLVGQRLTSGATVTMDRSFRERSDRTVVRFSPNDGQTTAQEDTWIWVDPRSDDGYEPLIAPWSSRSRIDWDVTGGGDWVVLRAD
ncbi:MAG: hypothetical protein ACJAYU_001811 [Bradymonadia bacterium]|jgi:hypothetical protein